MSPESVRWLVFRSLCMEVCMSCRVLRASGWRVCELVCPAADWSVLREFLLGVAWSNLRVHGGTCGL